MKVEAKKSTTIKTPLKILVPTDFSRNAAEALRFAVPLAWQFGAQITLLHVIAWEGNSRLLGAAGLADALNKSAQDPAHRLDKLARTTYCRRASCGLERLMWKSLKRRVR
jgi:nucleotide-binding universal stress UspA family protein